MFNAQDSSHYLMWQLRGNGADQLAPHVRQGNTFTVLKTVPLGTTLATGTDYRLCSSSPAAYASHRNSDEPI